jgi:FtsH-binding integral membrane protein
MTPIIHLDKTISIVQFFLFVIVLPFIVGIVVGLLMGRIKRCALKVTLIFTAIISLIFLFIIIFTLQNQSLPILAIILAIAAIIIMNTAAVMSHKVFSKMPQNKL